MQRDPQPLHVLLQGLVTAHVQLPKVVVVQPLPLHRARSQANRGRAGASAGAKHRVLRHEAVVVQRLGRVVAMHRLQQAVHEHLARRLVRVLQVHRVPRQPALQQVADGRQRLQAPAHVDRLVRERGRAQQRVALLHNVERVLLAVERKLVDARVRVVQDVVHGVRDALVPQQVRGVVVGRDGRAQVVAEEFYPELHQKYTHQYVRYSHCCQDMAQRKKIHTTRPVPRPRHAAWTHEHRP